MAFAVLIFALLVSLLLAWMSRRNRKSQSLEDFLVAGRSLGTPLFYLLAVGEIYSIGTIIGFPGGIYAGGAVYAVWFLGYILLAYPVGYFINPLLWQAGKLYGAETGPDLFYRHFKSRGLMLVVALASLIFVIPWGQLQFSGLEVLLEAFAPHLNPALGLTLAGALAFGYILIAGMRAPAMVSILKDTLLIASILIVGIAVIIIAAGVIPIFHHVARVSPTFLTVPKSGPKNAMPYVLSTIVFQALGFYTSPFGIQYNFTAKSKAAVKKAQMVMPLYMIMYPFLIISAFFSLAYLTGLNKNPDLSFIAAAMHVLPGWLVGVVAAGAALSAILVLAGVSLAISSVAAKNLINGYLAPDAPESTVQRWTKVAVGIYLFISILLTVLTPTLMLNLINTAYYGFTQFFPGLMALLFWRKATPIGVGIGLVGGDVAALAMYFGHMEPWGLNLGLLALVVNIVLTVGISLITPGTRTPIVHRNFRETQDSVSLAD
ncbi:sodium:solute symporter family protein [Sulfobacillus harzensis]|uniref:Sodium:solute symporter family protein n=1 Tax=Sulfobacillus harzensis TaxID=2729629 RepID=A0A7Y0L4D1_9FIRM|nr:sodium:solute symporter family protein [Sulfobacillus harzensis]NMP23093.1 sodium:solute symporter family protein [Sulfobacillus harzensis]